MRVYSRTWCSLRAPLGQKTCFTLPFPPQCMLKRITVQQTGNDPGETVQDFNIDIFDTERACPTNPSDSQSLGTQSDDTCVSDPEVHKVLVTLEGRAGKLNEVIENDGLAYCCQDGGISTRKRKIYVQFRPQGNGDATWDLTLVANIHGEKA